MQGEMWLEGMRRNGGSESNTQIERRRGRARDEKEKARDKEKIGKWEMRWREQERGCTEPGMGSVAA